MGWVSPTGHNTPTGGYDNPSYPPTNAYDENESSFALDAYINPTDWGDFLELTHSAIDIVAIRYMAKMSGGPYEGDLIDVDVYNGSWHHVYNGTYTVETWEEKAISLSGVTKARVVLYNGSGDGHSGRIIEFDFGTAAVLHEKEISEGIAVGEVVEKTTIMGFAEGVAMGEVLAKVITKAPFAEGVSIGEVVETVRIKVREFIEGLAIGEVLVKQAHKVIAEGIAIGEVLSKQISRVYSEGVAVGEVVIKLASKVFTEGLAIGEILGKYISKMFSEGLAIGEVLLKMRVLQSIRELSPFRVLDSLRNKLKKRQL